MKFSFNINFQHEFHFKFVLRFFWGTCKCKFHKKSYALDIKFPCIKFHGIFFFYIQLFNYMYLRLNWHLTWLNPSLVEVVEIWIEPSSVSSRVASDLSDTIHWKSSEEKLSNFLPSESVTVTRMSKFLWQWTGICWLIIINKISTINKWSTCMSW